MKLEFTDREISVIGAALGGMPYRDAAPIVASIKNQMAVHATPQTGTSKEDKVASATYRRPRTKKL